VIKMSGGFEAMQLRLAEQYISEFGNSAKSGTSMIVPANLSDVTSMLQMAMRAVKPATPEPKLPVRPAT
jgi:hypothetical protein